MFTWTPGLIQTLVQEDTGIHADVFKRVNAAYPYEVRLWDEDTGSTFEVRLCKSLDDAIYSARGATISQRALRAQRALPSRQNRNDHWRGRHRRPIGAARSSKARANDPALWDPMRTEARAVLTDALRDAHRWLDELTTSPNLNIGSLAAREGKTERWIRLTISLAFLCPARTS